MPNLQPCPASPAITAAQRVFVSNAGADGGGFRRLSVQMLIVGRTTPWTWTESIGVALLNMTNGREFALENLQVISCILLASNHENEWNAGRPRAAISFGGKLCT